MIREVILEFAVLFGLILGAFAINSVVGFIAIIIIGAIYWFILITRVGAHDNGDDL